jgi:hypothetical protein
LLLKVLSGIASASCGKDIFPRPQICEKETPVRIGERRDWGDRGDRDAATAERSNRHFRASQWKPASCIKHRSGDPEILRLKRARRHVQEQYHQQEQRSDGSSEHALVLSSFSSLVGLAAPDSRNHGHREAAGQAARGMHTISRATLWTVPCRPETIGRSPSTALSTSSTATRTPCMSDSNRDGRPLSLLRNEQHHGWGGMAVRRDAYPEAREIVAHDDVDGLTGAARAHVQIFAQ